MRSIISNGIRIDARLSHHLIHSIFQHNSPLHDGGIIIRENYIIAAHCIFPLSQDAGLQKTLGTRHRAAVGISEETDAVAIVVSEETGIISIACRGRLIQDVSPDRLSRFLSTLLKAPESDSIKEMFSKNQEEEVDKGANGFSDSPLNDE